jgi:hypothetical protein
MSVAEKVHSSLLGRAPAKDPKGTATKARRRAAARVRRLEGLYKAEAKILDHHRCQRPGCIVQGVGRVESAHLDGKGMGGDHGARSDSPACFVTTCSDCHQGPRSLHSTHLLVVPLSDRGADGPLAWYVRPTLTDAYMYFGTSRRFRS